MGHLKTSKLVEADLGLSEVEKRVGESKGANFPLQRRQKTSEELPQGEG